MGVGARGRRRVCRCTCTWGVWGRDHQDHHHVHHVSEEHTHMYMYMKSLPRNTHMYVKSPYHAISFVGTYSVGLAREGRIVGYGAEGEGERGASGESC